MTLQCVLKFVRIWSQKLKSLHPFTENIQGSWSHFLWEYPFTGNAPQSRSGLHTNTEKALHSRAILEGKVIQGRRQGSHTYPRSYSSWWLSPGVQFWTLVISSASTSPTLKHHYDKKGRWRRLNSGNILPSSLNMPDERCTGFLERLLWGRRDMQRLTRHPLAAKSRKSLRKSQCHLHSCSSIAT